MLAQKHGLCYLPKVELSDSPAKENVVAGTTKKRKSYPAQPGSTVSSTQRSDGEDDSIGSSDDDESIDAKRPRSNAAASGGGAGGGGGGSAGAGASSRNANRQKFKKPAATSNRLKVDEDDDMDSNDDDDNSTSKRLSSAASSKSSLKKRSNGTEKVKKSHSNSVSRKSSSTTKQPSSHMHSKEKRRSGKSSKSGGYDAEDDTAAAAGGDMFHYDSEECSARPCKQPQDIAIDWIQCDRCALWYHQETKELSFLLEFHQLDATSNLGSSTDIMTVSGVESCNDYGKLLYPHIAKRKLRLPVISKPVPPSIFCEPWQFILMWLRTNSRYTRKCGVFLSEPSIPFLSLQYIPPIHPVDSLSVNNNNINATSSIPSTRDRCYEALLFSTQANRTAVRVTLFKDSKTENDTFQCVCEPYINLPSSFNHLPISELKSIENFVTTKIWPIIEKEFNSEQ
uniref:Uncharacterized protein n=1 Tax=Trichobilharzia regenti TaxID=157069 RepID=A0AA85K7Y6_TRIRE|nr:unnamed protein product [Trichobilharzia regenti]